MIVSSLTRRSRIEKLFPAPGFLFPLLITILSVSLLSSCFSGKDESLVEDKTNFIMESLKQGHYEEIPEFAEAFKALDATAASDLKMAFKNMEEWTVSVDSSEKNRMKATVNIKMNENNKTLDLFFRKIDGQWVPEKEISIYQNVGFIPFIGAKNKP